MSEHIDKHGDVWRWDGTEATRIEPPVLIFSRDAANAAYGPFKPPLTPERRCPTCAAPITEGDPK